MKLAFTFASALAIHAAAAVGVTALGVVHGDASAHESVPTETMVSVEDTEPVVVHEDVAPANVTSTVHEASRGTPNPIRVLSMSANANASATNIVPEPPLVTPPSEHFKMTTSNNVGAPSGNSATPAVGAQGEVVADNDVTSRAQKIGGAQPSYPERAVAQGVELGSPIPFEIIVDTSGHVASVRPLQHAGYGFDEAAVVALRTFRFSPATRNGHPVNVRMRWTVEFKLD